MRARKSLGQHFLKSERALLKVVEVGVVRKTDTILEIGPGMGALTEKLLETKAKIIAVEKDGELFELLKQKFEKEISSGQLTLIYDDILNFDPSYSLLPTAYYKLIANIPYNITGAILKKFLSTKFQPKLMVLLVQKEVAERIVGSRGRQASTKESILSISVKVYGVPKYIETVKAGSFVPAPKVDSAIIAIEHISKDFFTRGRQASTGGFSEREFFELVHAGFKSKRKKLSSNLSTIFMKNKVLEVFRKLNLNENLRAEDISIETWQKLARNLLP